MVAQANGNRMIRTVGQKAKHDHRQSFWIIGGKHLWCYRCGAMRPNSTKKWVKPTGLKGKNPA